MDTAAIDNSILAFSTFTTTTRCRIGVAAAPGSQTNLASNAFGKRNRPFWALLTEVLDKLFDRNAKREHNHISDATRETIINA